MATKFVSCQAMPAFLLLEVVIGSAVKVSNVAHHVAHPMKSKKIIENVAHINENVAHISEKVAHINENL